VLLFSSDGVEVNSLVMTVGGVVAGLLVEASSETESAGRLSSSTTIVSLATPSSRDDFGGSSVGVERVPVALFSKSSLVFVDMEELADSTTFVAFCVVVGAVVVGAVEVVVSSVALLGKTIGCWSAASNKASAFLRDTLRCASVSASSFSALSSNAAATRRYTV